LNKKVTQRRILLASASNAHSERQLLRGFHALARERNWMVLNLQSIGAVESSIGHWDPQVCVVSPPFLAGIPAAVWGKRMLLGINVNAPHRRIASAHPDDTAAGTQAAEHVLAKGYLNFATFQIGTYPWSTARVAGFREAVEARGGSFHGDEIVDGSQLAQAELITRWARALPRGTAIFAACDAWGAILLQLFQINGIMVPEELAVIGVDDDELICEMCHPQMSSVGIPWEGIGRAVAKLADQYFRTGVCPPVDQSFPPTGVTQRRSTELLAVGHPTVAQALGYLRDRAHESVSVDEVVEHVTANRRWLERAFRRHLGRSILQEIRRAQIDRARRLLVSSRLAIPAIARGCGFGTATARFTRSFHKEVGVTPTEYRRQFTPLR
jgi:LacI family transcriptional regulator